MYLGVHWATDVLAGALSGAGCCSSNETSRGAGNFLLVVDPDNFGDGQDYVSQVGGLIDHIKSCPTAPGFDEVYVPGEMEHLTEQRRRRDGIPLGEATWSEIKQLAHVS